MCKLCIILLLFLGRCNNLDIAWWDNLGITLLILMLILFMERLLAWDKEHTGDSLSERLTCNLEVILYCEINFWILFLLNFYWDLVFRLLSNLFDCMVRIKRRVKLYDHGKFGIILSHLVDRILSCFMYFENHFNYSEFIHCWVSSISILSLWLLSWETPAIILEQEALLHLNFVLLLKLGAQLIQF